MEDDRNREMVPAWLAKNKKIIIRSAKIKIIFLFLKSL